MKFFRLITNNRVTIYILILIIVIMGIFSYVSLPKEASPSIKIPFVFVTTVYPGVSPQDIENLVTQEIEKEIKGITGVKKITSVYFMNVGENYFNADRYNPAVPVLEGCAYLDPENIPCRFFLGLVYKKWGEYDPSVANMKEALRLLLDQPARERYGPNDYLMLSRIYSELGDFDKAQKYEQMVQPDAANIPIPGTSRPE